MENVSGLAKGASIGWLNAFLRAMAAL